MPLNGDTAVGSDVPVRNFCMQDIGVPFHKVMIQSELWSGDAVVGVRPTFPIAGVSMIKGNDLAGGRVLVTLDVTPVPVLCTSPTELLVAFLMFSRHAPLCAQLLSNNKRKIKLRLT